MKNTAIFILVFSSLVGCSRQDDSTQPGPVTRQQSDLSVKISDLQSPPPPNLYKPTVPLMTDDDGNLRTVEYYQSHPEELNKKIWECRNFSQPREGYDNCLNAEKAKIADHFVFTPPPTK